MKKNLFVTLGFVLIIGLPLACKPRHIKGPKALQVEYLTDPLGIDTGQPRFSWQLEPMGESYRQNHYEIEVLQDSILVWSVKEASKHQNNVVYKGEGLQPKTQYQWRVRVSENGRSWSQWSPIGFFETGMMEDQNWEAHWIGDGKPVPKSDEAFYDVHPNPVFRKSFETAKKVQKARLYITGLGYYEAYLNGEKIGDRVLDPGWTNYGKEVLYSVYDVTAQIERENTLSVLLGNGWYNPLPMALFGRFNLREHLTIGRPKFIAELWLTFDDGSVETVFSDTSWKVGEGEILKNNVYLGEMVDANRLPDNWSDLKFDDGAWGHAALASKPGGFLVAQKVPPIRVTDTILAKSLTNPIDDVYVVDLGENFAGWLHATLPGLEGDTITLKYGELLHEDGLVNGMTTVAGHIKEIWNLGGGAGAPKTAYQLDTFMPAVDDRTFQQHFTFHGFRYVEISGLREAPQLDEIYGLRLNSDVIEMGRFECSNPLFNSIQDIVLRTFKSNIFSVESDCPGREKFGYGADIVTACEAYMFNYWMPNFYEKTVRDFYNDQRPNGGMPETAPYNGIQDKGFGEGSGPIGWQLAYPFVQWELYRFYGDLKLLEDHYSSTVRMVEHLKENAGDDYMVDFGIGDHVSLDTKNDTLTSSAFYYHNLKLVSKIASVLGKENDAQRYGMEAEKTKKAFIQRFYDDTKGVFGQSLKQSWQVFPLYYDLIPLKDRDRIVNNLRQSIKEKDFHFSTGIFGTKMLFDVLRREDLGVLAYEMVNQKDFPSYGFMLDNGATTLWEEWEMPEQASWNHPMFGSVSEWFYRSVLGINQTASSVGFEEVLIQPRVTEKMKWAKGYYNSIRGPISVDWRNEGEELRLNVDIPSNTSAIIAVPKRNQGKILEIKGFDSGNPSIGETITIIKADTEYLYLQVGGGKFEFISK